MDVNVKTKTFWTSVCGH